MRHVFLRAMCTVCATALLLSSGCMLFGWKGDAPDYSYVLRKGSYQDIARWTIESGDFKGLTVLADEVSTRPTSAERLRATEAMVSFVRHYEELYPEGYPAPSTFPADTADPYYRLTIAYESAARVSRQHADSAEGVSDRGKVPNEEALNLYWRVKPTRQAWIVAWESIGVSRGLLVR